MYFNREEPPSGSVNKTIIIFTIVVVVVVAVAVAVAVAVVVVVVIIVIIIITVRLFFVLVIKRLKCHQMFNSDLLVIHGASIQSCNAQRKWLEYHHLPDHTSLENVSKDNENN